MALQKISPVLYTGQVKETVAFYTTVLGFTLVSQEEALGWAAVEKDNVEIMFSLPNAHLPFTTPVFTGSLYITTNDVDGIWASLQNKVQLAYHLETFAYGMREFAIYDNNGYIIQFGQRVES